VAYYEVLKFREKKAREERLFSAAFIETMAAEIERTMDQSDARRDALTRCLGKLNARDRQLVIRRYHAGATTRSVAEALGRSVQGTRKSLHRIRTRLLECIERTLAVEERAR
jgi:RNA polymerase sigma-70 factor (ECF subfamily)